MIESAEVYGVILASLVIFLMVWENRRSLKDIASSLGLKRQGTVGSLTWSFALFPVFVVIGLVSMMLASFLGPTASLNIVVSSNGQFPLWYRYYLIAQAFFPVAVVEEMFARGYLLDRFMPEHPSTVKRAMPAIFLSSILFAVWHLPSYLTGQGFSGLQVVVLLSANVFPLSLILGVAYVRARGRNIVGPVLVHFLLDAIPVIIASV